MSSMKRCTTAATILLSCGPSAFARGTVPLVTGTYVSTTRVYCQPVLNVFHSNGAVNIMTLTQNAPTAFSTATETYAPATGKVTITSINEAGTGLLLDDDINGVAGNPIRESVPTTQTVPFSNTLSTLTINSVPYHVQWGLRQQNIPQYFVTLHLDTNGCVTQSEKTRQ